MTTDTSIDLASLAELHPRIEVLQQAYADCIDEERYDQWPDLFTDRCLYQIISRDNHRRQMPFGLLYCDSRGMLRDRIASMRSANIYEPHTYRHVLGRSIVTGRTEDGSVDTRTSYLVVRIMHDGAQEIFSTGVYLDRIVAIDDRLRFSQRIVVCDASRIDALLVVPL